MLLLLECCGQQWGQQGQQILGAKQHKAAAVAPASDAVHQATQRGSSSSKQQTQMSAALGSFPGVPVTGRLWQVTSSVSVTCSGWVIPAVQNELRSLSIGLSLWLHWLQGTS
jgi:hypothetical protein